MNRPNRNIRPEIRQLDEAAVNRIAAGEVVERPASAVKELVENALDAGATRIEVDYADGGKTLIRVRDDGCGMAGDDLPLALLRHATSKIDGSDLLNIHSFGFRGEALPSLGAVGRLRIVSRMAGSDGATIAVEGGRMTPVRPEAAQYGTVVELRDLFHATPARLKFMRSDRAEAQAIADTVKRLAMAEPYVSFTLSDVSDGDSRSILRLDAAQGALFDALEERLAAVLGREFTENALRIDTEREGLRLTGFAALPTYSRGAAVAQYFFVNGRPVRDKMLLGALRAAYMDLLSRDRHPVAALFITCNPELVDVNVHPAKSEVRFRDPGLARGAGGQRVAPCACWGRAPLQQHQHGRYAGCVSTSGCAHLPDGPAIGGGARDRLSVAGATGHGRKRGVLGRRRDHGRAQRYRARHTGPPPRVWHLLAPRARSCTKITLSRKPKAAL